MIAHPHTALGLVAALALGGVIAWGPLANAAPTPDSFAPLAEKVSPAVVNVSTTHQVEEGAAPFAPPFPLPEGSPFEDLFRQFGGNSGHTARKVTALGSGFIIDPTGYIVTNNHVIDAATDIGVTLTDGSRYTAKVVGSDPQTDLALLKVDVARPLPYVEWGDSDSVNVGDWILAVGNPFGLGGTMTAGIVSARSRDIHSGPFDDFLQVDASINQGNSGGPTFGLDGKVIGINTAIASPNGGSVGIGFAIPSNLARPVIAQLKEKGFVERGWLGVQIQPVTPEIAGALKLGDRKGAIVSEVIPQGPAATKLRQGDVILSFAGRPVEDMRDLPRMVAETTPGKTVDIGLWRDGKSASASVEIAKRPQDQEIASGGPAAGPADRVQSSALGVTLAPLTPALRQAHGISDDVKGVLVLDIAEDGKAMSEVLRPGDIILEVDRKPVATPAEVEKLAATAKKEKEKALLLLVNRNGDQLFVGVNIGEV